MEDKTAKKILVIDDEADVAELLQDYLKTLGFRVWIALNAEAGIQMAEEFEPELILLDVMMPQIGGLDCLRMLKKLHAGVIVVMISGVHDDKTAKMALLQGAYDYLTKPIDFNYFKSNILARIFPDLDPS